MSSFLPYGGTLPVLDAAFQEVGGALASVFGMDFDVRRLDALTNGSVSSNAPIHSNFPATLERVKKVEIENETWNLLGFEANCDARFLEIGDVVTATDYHEDAGIWTVVQRRPPNNAVWIRTESAISITRPYAEAGLASDIPIAGIVAAPDGTYSGTSKECEQVLTLKDGLYSFTTDPARPVASVYAGYQPRARLRDSKEPSLPGTGVLATALYREDFVVYVPLIPGETLNELDRLSFPELADRYQVALVFSTGVTGVAGYITLCERMAN